MNTQTQQHTPYLLDSFWVEAIEEALATTPQTVPFAVEPEALASYDVMHGIGMRPEQFYRTVLDVERYVIAYKDAVEAWADHVSDINAAQRQVHVLTDDECAAETADLCDWHEFMADIEWSKR